MIDPSKAQKAVSDGMKNVGEAMTDAAAKAGGEAAKQGAQAANSAQSIAKAKHDGMVDISSQGLSNRYDSAIQPRMNVVKPVFVDQQISLRLEVAQLEDKIAKMDRTLAGMMTPEGRQQMQADRAAATQELAVLVKKLAGLMDPPMTIMPVPLPFPTPLPGPKPIGPPVTVPPPGHTGGTGGTGGTTGNERLDGLVNQVVKTNNEIDDLLADYQKAADKGEDTFAIQTRIQQAMQRRLELITLLSNIQKMEHDATMAIVQNIR